MGACALLLGCNKDPQAQVVGLYKTHAVQGAGEQRGMGGVPIMTVEFFENKTTKIQHMRGSEGKWELNGDTISFSLGPDFYVAKFRPEKGEMEVTAVNGGTDLGNTRMFFRKE